MFDLQGAYVTLKPTTLNDRTVIFEWLALSDVTSSMMGPPTFPDKPIPSWEDFCADYTNHYFDGSAPELGRCFIILANKEPVGQINYNTIKDYKGLKRAELDIWLCSESVRGKGYGTDAILTLCQYLKQHFGVQEFMMQPSARNTRAIQAYEKVGFVRTSLSLEETLEQWGISDYYDSVYMIRQG